MDSLQKIDASSKLLHLVMVVRTKCCDHLRGERAMKEAIWGYLVKRIGKMENLLSGRVTEQTTGRILPERASRNSFHAWSQKTSQHAGPAAQKSNTHRFALLSLRLVLVLMGFCLTFLLTIAVQCTANAPAMAAGRLAS